MSMISGHGQVVYVKQVKLSQWADVEDARFQGTKGDPYWNGVQMFPDCACSNRPHEGTMVVWMLHD